MCHSALLMTCVFLIAELVRDTFLHEMCHAVVWIINVPCMVAERLRDTLIHEMCHAAVWVINRAREGHGPHWRYWCVQYFIHHYISFMCSVIMNKFIVFYSTVSLTYYNDMGREGKKTWGFTSKETITAY